MCRLSVPVEELALEPVTVRLNELDARLEAVLREAAALRDEQLKLRDLVGDTAKRLGVR